MLKDPDFYTVTMARVYENQGLWDKAAEIYQYLLKNEPQRKDLADALSRAEREMAEAVHKKPDTLVPLLREWINLLLQYNRLQALQRFKGKLSA